MRSMKSEEPRVFRDALESVLPPNTNLPARPVLEKVLGLARLDVFYSQVQGENAAEPFPERTLRLLGVTIDVSAEDLARIPAKGPVVVVANHPFGMVEGLVIAAAMERVRPDVRIMANHLLAAMPEARERMIMVDPFDRPGSARRNLASMRAAMEWLRGGGMLVLFPAGEVSHFDFSRRGITDPEWNDAAVRLAGRVNAPIVPVRFTGNNSALFHMLGFVHPTLRTAMLPHELWNKRGRPVSMRIGQPVDPEILARFENEHAATAFVRRRVYSLASRRPVRRWGFRKPVPPQSPVIDPIPAQALDQEILRLGADATLVKAGEMRVLLAPAASIPLTLREIGRLREVTFRQAGEGTGRPLDLDRFDSHYQHLILWNDKEQEVAGAYRLAPSLEVLPRHGVRGFYTSTLFAWKRKFLDRLGPSVELGRSFVRLEYQKSFSALLLLWKGIGQYLVKYPQYRVLFGPVSISNDYQPESRQLMVRFLNAYCRDEHLARLVRARNPFRLKARRDVDDIIEGTAQWDIDALSTVIADFETDQKGVPVLLRQYLKLGGRLVAFNVDSIFADTLDGLIVVDIAHTDRRALGRYMGVQAAKQYLEHHGVKDEDA
ncbi:MAG TPA: lysophospholipid acyltransferase family protein [Bryobacteraceae bacterium]|nr:lysophospholipid acyltransferase family protein [Bryobacteraceae bacterium]